MIIHNIKLLIKIRKIALLCLFISIPADLLGILLQIETMVTIGVALLIFYMLFSFLLWKCPYCKKRLPVRFNLHSDYINDIDNMYRCPSCNKKISL